MADDGTRPEDDERRDVASEIDRSRHTLPASEEEALGDAGETEQEPRRERTPDPSELPPD